MFYRFRHLLILLLLIHQQGLAANAEDMNRQIAMNREIKEIALSPNGLAVASIITDTTAAGGRPHLWILSKNRPPRQLVGMEGSSTSSQSSPAWSSDGRAILFLERTDAGAAIKRMEVTNGRTDILTLSRHDAAVSGGWNARQTGQPLIPAGFALAASGALAVWASDPSDTKDKEAAKSDQPAFGQSDPVRLYVIRDGAAPREIPLPDNVHAVAWRQDGRSLLVITEPPSDDLGERTRLWLIEEGKAPREIQGTAENVQTISWLPDGRVIYFARCRRNAPIVCRDLYVQALDGAPPRDLTENIDGSLIHEPAASANSGPVITGAGDALITVAKRFDRQIARIRLADGAISWMEQLPPVVKTLTSNDGRSGFAMLASSRGGVSSVQLVDAHLRKISPLAGPALQPADWKLLQGRRLEWTSDGHKIDGLLYLPDVATTDRPVPLVVDVHGGPAEHFEDIDYPLVRLMLQKEWAVLHVNPRGSFGYGVDFLAALQDDLGGIDYRDIMSGVDAALMHAPLDKDKVAMIGFSYGATITTFALGRTDRFKALVAAAPVVDQISEYGTEHSSWYDRWYFGQPWRRLDAAWRQSPLAGVAAARTPLLLLHGESDTVNPLGQSLELYRALRQEGSPVELMLFPRESHRELGRNFVGFVSVEPHHGIALRQRMLDFLSSAFSGQAHAGLNVPSANEQR